MNMLWRKISCGFDTGDETANFGTREVALNEDEGSMYETVTRATIQPSDDDYVGDIPNPIVVSCSTYVAISIDSSLTVFPSDFSTICAAYDCLQFPVEAMAFSSDCSVLYVVLKGSMLLAVHIASMEIFPIAKELVGIDLTAEFIPTFLHITSDNENCLYIADSTQRLFRVSMSVCISDIILEEDAGRRDELTAALLSNSEVTILEQSSPNVGKRCVTTSFFKDHYPGIVWVSSYSMKIFYDDYCSAFSLNISSEETIKDVIISPCSSFAFCLMESGIVYVVSMDLEIVVNVWTDKLISSFTLISPSTDSVHHYQLLALILNTDPQLALIDCPEFKILYTLNVPANILLYPSLRMDDNLHYLEIPDLVYQFKFKCIEETLPVMRLNRLIAKGRFEEAEALARIFSLDFDSIQQAKVERYLSLLSPYRSSYESEDVANEHFSLLMSALASVQNTEFVLEACSEAMLKQLDWTQQLLHFALDKAKKVQFENGSLVKKLIDLEIRLNLFTLLNYPDNHREWMRFSSVDLISECRKCLSNGDINDACTILSVLKICYQEVCEKRGHEILRSCLPILSTKDLFTWFEAILDTILVAAPDILCNAIVQITNTIRNHFSLLLSSTDSSCEEGIQAIKMLAQKCRPLTPLSDDSMIVVDSETYKLLPWLANQLQSWNHLRSTHSIIIPFELLSARHSEGACYQIISYLFDFVPTNGIKFLVEDYIASLCKENGLSCDKCICDYLNNYMNSINWWDDSHDNWEMRCIEFANSVSSKMDKAGIMITLLNKAAVPWVDATSDLAQSLLESVPSKRDEIMRCIKMAKKKMIWKKYNLLERVDYVDTTTILKYIVRSGKPTVWTDMKDYVATIGPAARLLPYNVYLNFCIREGNVKQALDLFVSELNEKDLNTMKQLVAADLDLRRVSAFGASKETVKLLSAFVTIPCNPCSPEYSYDSQEKIPYMPIILLLKERFDVELKARPYTQDQKIDVLVKCVQHIFRVALPKLRTNLNNYLLFLKAKCNAATLLLNLPPQMGFAKLARISLDEQDMSALNDSLRIISEETFLDIDNEFKEEIICLCTDILRQVPVGISGTASIFHYAHDLVALALSHPQADLSKMNDLLIINDLLTVLDKPGNKTVLDHWGVASVGSCPDQLTFTQEISPITSDFLQIILNRVFDKSAGIEIAVPAESGDEGGTSGDVSEIEEKFYSFLQNCPADLHSVSSTAKIYWILTSCGVSFQSVLKEVNHKLICIYSNNLLNLLSMKTYDMILALGLLHYLPAANQLQWLTNVGSGRCQKNTLLWNAALLGSAYCGMHQLEEMSFYRQYMGFQWDSRLKKLNLRFSIDNNSKEQLEVLFIRLMKVPNVPLELLERFCSDFSLDYQKLLLVYLNDYLSSWEPKFTQKTFDDVSEMKAMFTTEVTKLLDVGLKVMSDFENKALLKSCLIQLWCKISWYNYEVFFVIISLLDKIALRESTSVYENHMNLLYFLQSYRRQREPGAEETEMWSRSSVKNDCFPKIALYRLPFTVLNDFTSFMKPEFRLSTYTTWMRLLNWFNSPIDKNVVCLSAIQNLKSESFSSSSSWNLYSENKQLLSEIYQCLSCITCPKMATSGMYFVVNHVMPPGADQLEAIQKCNLTANEWLKIDKSEEALRLVKKVKHKYLAISTTHLLYKYKLASPDYLRLVSAPRELITALYRDPSIISSDVHDDCDINAVVDKICFLYEVKDLKIIKTDLLTSWLEGDTISMDDTSIMGSLSPNSYDFSSDLKRACYMMKGEDPRMACSMLLGLVINEGVSSVSVPKSNLLKMRGLQCLMSIVSPCQLEAISDKRISYFRRLLQKLEVLCQLESAGLYFNSDGLESDDIILAAGKRLIQTGLRADTSLIAAKIVSFPFATPEVSIPLWTPVIAALTQFYQISALEKYLPLVTKIARYLDTAVLTAAWQLLIEFVLRGANDNNISDVKKKISDLLQCSVVLQRIKLNNLMSSVNNDELREIINKFLKHYN